MSNTKNRPGRLTLVKMTLRRFLSPVVGEDYLGEVVGLIAKDVAVDLDEAAEREFNDSDLRLAVGRVLCERRKGGD